ncbi:MAG: hypothetical protein HZB92_06040 [Euryarchaeota archaeon]|nr:hypothetical protein [Euryarchaeota archaeon]
MTLTKLLSALAVLLLLTSTACALTIQVRDAGYQGIDSISSSRLWNTYTVKATSGKRIQYKFDVLGSGTIKVYFTKSGQSILSTQYYVSYSTDVPVSSYSNSFGVGSEDGDSFDIIVMTDSFDNVTYNASISITEPSIGERALTAGIVIGVIVIVVVVLFLKHKWKKKYGY